MDIETQRGYEQSDADGRPTRNARLVYFGVAGVLAVFWAGVALFVGVAVALNAREDDVRVERVEVAVTTTPQAVPTLRPKPAGAPVSAQRMTDFDTGDPTQHLFFHVGCEDGILAVVTTDEIVLAEWPCEGVVIERSEIEPFLGKPVRIKVADGDYLSIESPGVGKLEFNVDSAWLVATQT